MLAKNPKLRVVGSHLASMETHVDAAAKHFDRYSNFAVDTAARLYDHMSQSPEKVRSFMIKYQNRVLYGTDLTVFPWENEQEAIMGPSVYAWEERYARDWRCFAYVDAIDYKGRKIWGLELPRPVLRNLFHDNALWWFPEI